MRIFSLLILLSFATHAQVENWGGPIERIENVLGMGFTCNEADRAEVEFIDCQIPTLQVTNLTDQMNFDQISEELIFMEAARRNHQFVSCQRKLYDGLKEAEVRRDLKKNAYLQFRNIRETLGERLQAQSVAQETVSTFRPANFSEDRFNTRYNNWRQERLSSAQSQLAAIEGDIKNLVARIPLGNRKEVKEKITDILKTNPDITEDKFNEEYEKLISTLDSQVSESESFFNGIKVSQGDGTNLYSVDDDMKLSLIRMGQVNNVVASLGMRERLSQGFVCRARARYETGPRARMALEIPLYFAGAYGLGRLAVRAGVGAISTTARAGMIGLDIVEGARAVEETMNACFPDEFLSGSLDESCTGESEISSVYQEADIAACVTTGVLSVAPVAFVGGVRIWARTSGRTAPRVAPAAQAVPEEAAENVIVVTARRERVTTRARAESENAPQRAPTNLPRSEGELPKVAQNKINLVSERIQRLRFANRDPNAVTGFVKNKKLKRGISEAFTKMNDPAYVSQYMSELQEETFRVMLASGDSKLRSMANWGKIDKETMINVLKSRASRNGVNVVRIEQAEGSLSTQAFNARIGQGYLIDHGFPEGISHGTYTHLLQQDMAYDVISRVSGKPHSEIVEFFGTSDGMRVWDNMFDADPKLLSPHSPEYFQNNIMKNNVPLGYIRRDKTPGSDNRLLLPV